MKKVLIIAWDDFAYMKKVDVSKYDWRLVAIDNIASNLPFLALTKDRCKVVYDKYLTGSDNHVIEDEKVYKAIDEITKDWDSAPNLVILSGCKSFMLKYIDYVKEKWHNKDLAIIGPQSEKSLNFEKEKAFFKETCKSIGINTADYELNTIKYYKEHDPKISYPFMMKTFSYEDSFGAEDRILVSKIRDRAEFNFMLNQYQVTMQDNPDVENIKVMIEKFIQGYEISCGSFFNGNHFTGPVHHILEYKRFAAGDVGPNGAEAGAHNILVENPEKDYLFSLLKKFEPILKENKYHGYFDVNFMVENLGKENQKIYSIECDLRFPDPTYASFTIENDLLDCLIKCANEDEIKTFKIKKHTLSAIVFHMGYPYGIPDSVKGHTINGLYKCKQAIDRTCCGFDLTKMEYVNNSKYGDLFEIVGMGDTVEEAQKDLRAVFDSIHYPYILYRTDIGNHPYIQVKEN